MDVEAARAILADRKEALARAEAQLARVVAEAPDSDEPLFPDGHIKPGWHAVSCDECESQNYVRDDAPGGCPNGCNLVDT